jgi:outer membrane lipopolysaccharide assembly protein LptE/RlpB
MSLRWKRGAAARAIVACAALSCLTLAGCGYNLVGRGSTVPPDIRSVVLKALENKTQRQQVDQILTQAIAKELVTRKRFTVVNDASGADAEISGSVVGFGVVPVTLDPEGRATQYEISITAQVKFRRIKDDKVLWSNDRYNFRASYLVPVSNTAYFDRETLAIEEVAPQFAQTMVSDLLEGF